MSNLNTHPLNTPPTAQNTPLTFVLNNAENVKNALLQSFPQQSANAVQGLADFAAFNANNFLSQYNYKPDPDELIDMTQAFGVYLNRPVYGALILGNTDPNVQNGNQYTGIDGNTYTFDNIVLPIALVQMNQPTNVVKTNITGAPGSVKEYIGLGDWEITINGVVIYPADQSPVPFLRAFMRLKSAPVAIPVTNYFMNALGVTHIVIEDFDPVQEEGGYSKVAFTIKACSDIPITEFLP